MRDWFGEFRDRGRVAAAAAAVALFWYVSVFGFWLIPGAARLAAQSLLSSALSRPVAIESVRFDPYTFWFGVYGVKVFEPDQTTVFCSFDAFEADIELTRAFAGVISVKDVLLDAPLLRLARKPDGALNIADLLGGGGDRGQTPVETGFALALPRGLRLELANLRLTNGKAVFVDEARGTGHAVDNLHFYLPYFSTGDLARLAVLESTSLVDSSPFRARLVLDFSGEAVRVEFDATVRDVVFERFADFFPRFNGLNAQAQSLTLAVNAAFSAGGAPEVTADLDASGLLVGLPGGGKFFSAAAFGLENVGYDFATGGVRIGRAALRDYALDLSESPGGGLRLPWPPAEQESRRAPGAGAFAPEDLPDLVLARLVLDDGVVRLTREGEDAPALTVTQADVSGWGLNLREGVIDQIDVFLKSDLCAKAWLRLGGRMSPPRGQAQFDLSGCDLGRLIALAPKQAGLPQLAGKSALSGLVTFAPGKAEPEIALSKGRFEVTELKVSGPGSAEPALTLGKLTLEGAQARYPEREVSLAKVAVSGGAMNLRLDAGGGIGLTGLAEPASPGKSRADESPPKKSKSVEGTLRVGEFAAAGFTVALSGGALSLPVTAEIESLSVQGAAYPPVASLGPIKAQVKAGLGTLGRFEAAAEIAQSLDAASGSLKTGSLSLPALAQFVPALPVKIASGAATIDGTFACSLPKTGEPGLSFAGDVKLASLLVAPPAGGDPSWLGSLSIVKLAIQTSPLSLGAESLELDGSVARLEVSKQGRLTFAGFAVPQKTEAAPGAAEPAKAQAELPLSLGRLKLSGVKLDFIDHGFEPPFKANVWLEATVLGIAPKKPFGLVLSVVVNGSGRIKAEGSLTPPGVAPAFDVKTWVENLDLAEGSAYARRFTGFPIATGKLSLTGEYKLSNNRLDLRNKLKVFHIQVGPKAPDAAASIPLDLAVSLLGDASGNIELDVPVTGDLSGVKVDLGQAIGHAVGGVFGKVLLGPFAFLTMGGKTGQTMPLPFAPGSPVVKGEAARRLADLAKALADKPKATLEITGYADQFQEPEGIKRYALQARVAEAMGRSGQMLNEADYARLLGRYYTRTTGGKKPAPVAEMENELLSGFALGPEDARTLAHRRAVSVREFLIAQGVNEANIYLVPPDNPTPKAIEGVPFSRAELTLKR